MRRLLMWLLRKLWPSLFAALLLAGCAHAGARERGKRDELAGEALYRTGVQLADGGDLTRGEQYLSAALRLGHAPAQTLKALIATCVRAGRLRSALAYATPYLADHPRESGLRLLVASLDFALGEWTQSERQLRELLHQQESLAQAHYLLALLLRERAAPEAETSAHFRRYLELSPGGPHSEEARAALEREAAPMLRPVLHKRRG